MSENTIAENQRRSQVSKIHPLWLFGYGSLIFKADFPYLQKQPAWIENWERRFWQGSHDHRGTEHAPGRVVTLIGSEDAICHGMAYQIEPEVLAHLDYREKNGYLRFSAKLFFNNVKTELGLVYIATEENTAYLGPAPEHEIANQIKNSVGPSGRNIDYLFDLSSALRELSALDDHVFSLEKYLRKYL